MLCRGSCILCRWWFPLCLPPSCLFTTPRPPRPTLFPYTTLFRSLRVTLAGGVTEDISIVATAGKVVRLVIPRTRDTLQRSEEHTSELQSPVHLVCRLLLEKKNGSTHCLCTCRLGRCWCPWCPPHS